MASKELVKLEFTRRQRYYRCKACGAEESQRLMEDHIMLWSTVTSYGEFVDHLKSRMQKAHELARSHLGVVTEREKKRHDFKLNLKQYHQGDL